MILSAAGAVDHDAILRMAEAQFGHLKPQKSAPLAQASFKGGEHREIKALEQVHFALALESPGYLDDGIYTSQIFATIFGGGMSSRLFQEVREKRGLCYTIFAQAGAYVDTGMMTIYAGTSAEQIGDLATITIDELRRAASDISETEVMRARAQLKAGLLMGMESPSTRAERLARMVSIWGRVPDIKETVAKIDAVNSDQVRDIAASLAAGSSALALYGPVEKALDLGDLRARLMA